MPNNPGNSSAIRAAAVAVKNEDGRRLFRNAALRKRRKEIAEQMDAPNRLNKVLGVSF